MKFPQGFTLVVGSQSTSLSGYIVGLGYKQIITSSLYGFVEANYMGYSAPSYSYNQSLRDSQRYQD